MEGKVLREEKGREREMLKFRDGRQSNMRNEKDTSEIIRRWQRKYYEEKRRERKMLKF